jgi:hypothetical protein
MPSVGILGQEAAVGGKRAREEGGDVDWSTAHFERLRVGDEERHAAVGYVVRDLNGQLYEELMDGLRWREGEGAWDVKGKSEGKAISNLVFAMG